MIKQQTFHALVIIFSIALIACEGSRSGTDVAHEDNNATLSVANPNDSINSELDNKSNTNKFTTATADDSEPYVQPISEYAYVAAGNHIEMYKIESSGNLISTGLVTPTGISSTARISSIAISPNHLNLYATIQNNNESDKIWMLGLNAVNGKLTPLSKPIINTIKKHGTSSIVVSRNSMFVYTTDSTQVCTYRILDSQHDGTLPDNPTFCISPPAADGKLYPYGQIKLSANGKYAFVSGGPNLNTIITLKRESSGALTPISQPLNTGVNNNLSMSIPESGGFIYTALKSNYSVGQYQIDRPTGKVKPLSPQSEKSGTSSSEPHAVVLTPNRKYAYVTNYHDNTISIFNINEIGTLQSSPRTIIAAGGPDKIAMDKTGSFIYASTKDKHILQYKISHETGDLTPLSNAAIPIWESGANIAITDIEGLHMSLISPVYTHDVPLDAKYVIGLSNGYTESSVRAAGNIIACQIEESKYHPESMAQVSVSTLSGGSGGCPSGFGTVGGLTVDLNGPETIAITAIISASYYVMFYLTNIIDAFGNTYPDREFVVDTTVAENAQTSPESGAKNVSTHSGLYFTFTEPIKPDSAQNKITVTYHKEDGGIEMINLGGVTAAGTTLGAAAPANGLPVGDINAEATAKLTSGAVATAAGTATIIEESQESKLIIYVAIGRNFGYTGNLAQYDPIGGSGIQGADNECNAAYNKPPRHTNSLFKALIASDEDTIQARYPPIHPYPGEDWVLLPNTPYYNERESYISTTNNFGVFSQFIPFRNAIGDIILGTLRLSEVWTGIGIVSPEYWVASGYDCDGWTRDTINDPITITDRAVKGNSLATDNLRAINAGHITNGQGNHSNCNQRNGIYCAEQP